MSVLSVNGYDSLNKSTTTRHKQRLDYERVIFLHEVMPLIKASLQLGTFRMDQLNRLFVSRECSYVWENIKKDMKKHQMEKKDRDRAICFRKNHCEIMERKMRSIAQETLANSEKRLSGKDFFKKFL